MLLTGAAPPLHAPHLADAGVLSPPASAGAWSPVFRTCCCAVACYPPALSLSCAPSTLLVAGVLPPQAMMSRGYSVEP